MRSYAQADQCRRSQQARTDQKAADRGSTVHQHSSAADRTTQDPQVEHEKTSTQVSRVDGKTQEPQRKQDPHPSG